MYSWLSYTHCKCNSSWEPCCRITQAAPGHGSKPGYCLNPTGNKEAAGKAADSCLKYVPIQTFLFLSAWVCFLSQRSLQKPEGARGQSGRSLLVLRSLSRRDEHAWARTHTAHTQGGERQAVRSCFYPFFCLHLWLGRLLKMTQHSQPKCPCLAPSQEEAAGDTEQFLHLQTARQLSVLVGKCSWASDSCWALF